MRYRANKIRPEERTNAADGQPENIMSSLTTSGGEDMKITNYINFSLLTMTTRRSSQLHHMIATFYALPLRVWFLCRSCFACKRSWGSFPTRIGWFGDGLCRPATRWHILPTVSRLLLNPDNISHNIIAEKRCHKCRNNRGVFLCQPRSGCGWSSWHI